MTSTRPERLLQRRLVRRFAIVGAAAMVAMLAGFQFLQPLPPGTIVIASGVDGGLYHRYAQQYASLLAEHGVRVVERQTSGAADNYALLLDRTSGVDVAFLQGGIATQPEADDLVMLASLYVEPLWIFYRGEPTLTRLNQFVGTRP